MTALAIQKNENSRSPEELAAQWEQLKKETPSIRIRDAAERLGVTELELLATNIGSGVTRLKNDFQSILLELKQFGEVMALTRNDSAVHERKGVYDNITVDGITTVVLNPDIDLRLFLARWGHGFAVEEEARGKTRQSFQFFGKDGVALHKVYLTEKSQADKYAGIVAKFKSDDQSADITIEAPAQHPGAGREMPDSAIDVEGFRAAWRALKDTHDFYMLLRQFKLGRVQALRVAGEELAYQVNNNALKEILTFAAEAPCEVMIFVGNPGGWQIHTGPVEKLVDHDGWFNVLDEKFNLHVKEKDIASIWITKKPTVDGVVTGVEIFDAKENNIALIFGKRKPGIPELEKWRELVAKLPRKK